MKVLIVSRDERKRAWVRSALGTDWTVREAGNGVDAVRRAQTGEFDVVVTDQAAEPYGSFGLCRDIKLLPDPPAILIILDRPQDEWLARWSGADRWMLGPVDPFAIGVAVRELAAQQDAGDVELLSDEPTQGESETPGVPHYPR